ncbi:hypothetical protein FJTKL_00152 [Diaporthe vaccinii]|uniref:Uncharacterized protein n=1 Tax=Diaporthe vaccinii TaxID=105482 RepID=A0ABR4E4I3_9PEZI
MSEGIQWRSLGEAVTWCPTRGSCTTCISWLERERPRDRDRVTMTLSRVKRACDERSFQTASTGAKEGWGCQKLNSAPRLLRSGRCGQGGAALRTAGSVSKFGWEVGGVERDEGPDEITLPRSRRAGQNKEGPGQLGSWGNVG